MKPPEHRSNGYSRAQESALDWFPMSLERLRSRRRRVLVAVGLSGLLALEAAGESVQDAAAIAGLWELDPEESDDPAEVMARAAERAGNQRGRRGRRRGGMVREGRGPAARGRAGMGLPGLPELLEIEAGEGELRLLLDERVQILYLDGEEHAREDGRGGRITSEAEIRGGIVRVREVRRLPMGEIRVFRTFQASGDVLVVRTEFTPPRGGDPLLLRSVYRRVP